LQGHGESPVKPGTKWKKRCRAWLGTERRGKKNSGFSGTGRENKGGRRVRKTSKNANE